LHAPQREPDPLNVQITTVLVKELGIPKVQPVISVFQEVDRSIVVDVSAARKARKRFNFFLTRTNEAR
jgi:hypothetical protein